jgi:hypothetical protein
MRAENHKNLDEAWPPDDGLDFALRQYGEAEPRPGLEERVLANLRADRGRTVAWAWWPWAALAGVAAIAMVVAVPLLRKPGKTTATNTAQGPLTAINGTEARVTNGDKQHPVTSPARVLSKRPSTLGSHSTLRVAASLKLEQFPSPQPLSEQEEILASYVAQYQEQAVLVARARTQELQRDRAEEMRETSADAGNANSDQQMNETQNR